VTADSPGAGPPLISPADLEELFECAPGYIAVVRGPEHVFQTANAAYRGLVGHRRVIGMRARDVLPELEAQGYLALLDDVYRSGKPYTAENAPVAFQRVPGAEPETRYISFVYQPIRDAEGKVAGIFAEGVDVTEAKVSEARLKELNDHLEQAVAERTRALTDALQRLRAETSERRRVEEALRQSQKMEAIGQLTGGIAHDFNNLLAAVVGNVDLILKMPADPDRVRRWAGNALEAAQRGGKLTGQLLAFSRSQRIELKPLIVAEMVAGLRDMLSRTLGPLVQLVFDLDEERVPVLSDRTQLEMAVINLAINARDAMPEGGTLTIATVPRQIEGDPELKAGDYVELRVTDTGIGMAPEVAARAFDPFFTTKGVGRGTGLGLSQVYGIARQAGGTARIESAPDEGTTVRLFLRRTDAAALAEEASQDGAAGAGAASASILVVDDDPDVRRLLVECLEALGYKVTEAEDGAAALAALDRVSPDLLLVDFAMPGMNGAEVATAARERHPGLPVLFASGYSDTAAIEAVAGPEAAVLRKPFRFDALRDAVAAALGKG
jgi:signal transduction histidine kinase